MQEKTYVDLLHTANWQKKRLEIMQRDDWSCQHCGEKESQLHVHHKYYDNGKLPWDYPDSALITLCEHCHEEEHSNRELDHQLNNLHYIGFTNEKIAQILHLVYCKSQSCNVFEELLDWEDVDLRANYMNRDVDWENKHKERDFSIYHNKSWSKK